MKLNQVYELMPKRRRRIIVSDIHLTEYAGHFSSRCGVDATYEEKNGPKVYLLSDLAKFD